MRHRFKHGAAKLGTRASPGQPWLIGRLTNEYIDLDKAINCGIIEAYGDRAFTLQLLNFHYDAIDDFNKAIEECNCFDSNLYFGRANSKQGIEDYDGAISDLTKALEYSKDDNERNREYSLMLGYSITLFYEMHLNLMHQSKDLAQAFKELNILRDPNNIREKKIKRRYE